MAKPLSVTDAEFDQVVLKSDIPVVVDFWASWCGPCRAIAPILEDLATEYDGRLKITKVNVDENPRKAHEYGIQGIPTLIIFKDGKKVETIVGSRQKSDYKRVFDRIIG